jgi:hypothetical protein
MNVKLLRKIQKHILAEPKRFIMGAWIQRRTHNVDFSCDIANLTPRTIFPDCGTAACIAGWAILLSRGIEYNPEMPRIEAKHLLKIQTPQDSKLFQVAAWPIALRKRFRKAKRRETAAKIAAERIDLFIATKGRD